MITKNGEDVTAQVMAGVAGLQNQERARNDDFDGACVHLTRAKFELDNLPRPWQTDDIHRTIQAIEAIIADLRGKA